MVVGWTEKLGCYYDDWRSKARCWRLRFVYTAVASTPRPIESSLAHYIPVHQTQLRDGLLMMTNHEADLVYLNCAVAWKDLRSRVQMYKSQCQSSR
eukprot:scaffold53912_cov22-Cyclotella_meneghiniana.AAC.1